MKATLAGVAQLANRSNNDEYEGNIWVQSLVPEVRLFRWPIISIVVGGIK